MRQGDILFSFYKYTEDVKVIFEFTKDFKCDMYSIPKGSVIYLNDRNYWHLLSEDKEYPLGKDCPIEIWQIQGVVKQIEAVFVKAKEE